MCGLSPVVVAVVVVAVVVSFNFVALSVTAVSLTFSVELFSVGDEEEAEFEPTLSTSPCATVVVVVVVGVVVVVVVVVVASCATSDESVLLLTSIFAVSGNKARSCKQASLNKCRTTLRKSSVNSGSKIIARSSSQPDVVVVAFDWRCANSSLTVTTLVVQLSS